MLRLPEDKADDCDAIDETRWPANPIQLGSCR